MKTCDRTLNVDSADVLQRLWIATDEDQNQFLHIVVLKSQQTRSEPNNREVEEMDMTSQLRYGLTLIAVLMHSASYVSRLQSRHSMRAW